MPFRRKFARVASRSLPSRRQRHHAQVPAGVKGARRFPLGANGHPLQETGGSRGAMAGTVPTRRSARTCRFLKPMSIRHPSGKAVRPSPAMGACCTHVGIVVERGEILPRRNALGLRTQGHARRGHDCISSTLSASPMFRMIVGKPL